MQRRDLLRSIVGSPVIGILVGRSGDAATHGPAVTGNVFMAFSNMDRLTYRGVFSSPAEAARTFVVDVRQSSDDHLYDDGLRTPDRGSCTGTRRWSSLSSWRSS